ncbi:MAG: guanylate kinase [Candidatus Dormibacteria bacterium]
MSETGGGGRGRLIVLSGPSGVGKDTVIRRLLEFAPGLRRPVAFTTRLPRPAEQDGRDYSFVSEEQFLAMTRVGEFLETAVVHGHHYGTSRSRVDELRRSQQDVLLKIDVQGAAQLRQQGSDAIFIFLAPPSQEVLLTRLTSRHTESPRELAIRTTDAKRELAEASWYHHVVVNDLVDRAAREIAEVVAGDPR